MPLIDINGTQLHYQRMGQGPAVVMIHGLLLGNMASWYFSVASQLAARHEVLLYDLRGHGMSSMSPQGYDLETMVDDLEILLDTQGVRDVALIGHSYGAIIALQFAQRYPERVSRLVCIEGPLPLARGLEMDEFRDADPESMLAALPVDLQKSLGTGSRQGRKLLTRLNFLLNETNLLAQLRGERQPILGQPGRYHNPALLIYGTQSKLVDVPRQMQSLLPQARLSWLPGGHYLPSEMPQELGRTIGEFFS
ncbi:MAG: alpha/beta hydrolase [Pseudobdellovibrionaceae bacterium]|uniref:alpha/beta fold hydrolase n=1 Tax=Oligoflexus sp. TaxID=1971216 RepID=UPI0027C874FE|nr:alpha/beta hydrolase [Oligoflexus sp.]MDQ3231534.1 alpha/beta hydrolase [Pseudobdellovibrionaceae bacterium]HYX38569.1 alpha/beta hydrolase [Oligoflexus sp.]